MRDDSLFAGKAGEKRNLFLRSGLRRLYLVNELYRLEKLWVVCFKIVDERLIKLCRCECVVLCPEGGSVFYIIVSAQPSATFGIQIFIYFLCDFESVDPHFFKRHPVFRRAALHEAVIERDIVPDQYVVFAEIKKIRYYLPAGARGGYHFVCDSGEICDRC